MTLRKATVLLKLRLRQQIQTIRQLLFEKQDTGAAALVTRLGYSWTRKQGKTADIKKITVFKPDLGLNCCFWNSRVQLFNERNLMMLFCGTVNQPFIAIDFLVFFFTTVSVSGNQAQPSENKKVLLLLSLMTSYLLGILCLGQA